MALFLITAPSGAGKTTLVQELARYDIWEEAISHTTREMRSGEIADKTYYYISKEEFLEGLDNNKFVEHVEYDGNFYGVSHDEIKRVSGKNKHVAIVVERKGYEQIKKKYPEAVGIFLYMSKDDCMSNMLSRGDSIEKANRRIATYDRELNDRNNFDYVIKNVKGKLPFLVSIVKSITDQYDRM